MEYKDYYKIIGVDKKASPQDIKKAYRKLARKYHPDVNKGSKESEARFKEINEAYEVIGDAEKRKKYDELGANWRQYEQWQRAGGAQGQPFDWSQFGFAPGGNRGGQYRQRTVTDEDMQDMFGSSGGFSNFFYTFFSGAGQDAHQQYRPAPRKGRNIEQPVEITLEESFSGTTRMLQMSGPGGNPRTIEANIPPGVQDRSRIRLRGQGGQGASGGPAGDLNLVIHVKPHHVFERIGDDINTKVSVPLLTAILGGEIDVPVINGKVKLKIPPETQNGRKFRLKGKGMPLMRNPDNKGDLHVEVRVVLPQKLSDREREIFKELASLQKV